MNVGPHPLRRTKPTCQKSLESVRASHCTHKHKQKKKFSFFGFQRFETTERTFACLQIPSLSLSLPNHRFIWKQLPLFPTSGFIALSGITFSPAAIWYNQIQWSTTLSLHSLLVRRASFCFEIPKEFHFKGFIHLFAFLFCSFTYFSVCLFACVFACYCDNVIREFGGWSWNLSLGYIEVEFV